MLRRCALPALDADFTQGYGMTELAPVATTLGPEYHTPEYQANGKMYSAGLPGICLEVRVVDALDNEVPRGTVGEIIVRGPNVMLGYWKKPEATAEALRGGWMHTRDGGYMDADGFIYVCDRLKDMVVSGGENIYSAEVETAIASHPAVAQSAVIGIPCKKWGETVHAVIILKPGVTISSEEVIAHCRERIAGYKVPRSIEFRDSEVSSMPSALRLRGLLQALLRGHRLVVRQFHRQVDTGDFTEREVVVDLQLAQGKPRPVPVHNGANRGKRSVVADLKTAEGREVVLKLIESADVLIEGMRPGVMERLGLRPEQCRVRNPRLVYGRMTGWGQHGPMANAAGHDNNYIALSGALYHSGTAGEAPSSPITLIGDIGGGALYLAIGVLAGVLKARQTGQGSVVDAAIVDGSAHMMQLMMSLANKGLLNEQRGKSVHDGSHFYATYRCADDRYVALGSMEPQFYSLLLNTLGLQDDPRFARQWDASAWPVMREALAELFASQPRQHWCDLLEGSDACFAPVLSPREAAQHPHMVERNVYFERDGLLQAHPAPRFDGQVVTPGPIPTRGAHTEQVLSALDAQDLAGVWGR
nr:CoA transferase [Pseudomonas fluorescens]